MNSIKLTFIVLSSIILFENCKEKEKTDPDLALQNLKLETVNQYGNVWYIQKNNWVLSMCDGNIQVKDYTNPLSPGACTGEPLTGIPECNRSFYSETGDTVVMWISKAWIQDNNYYIVNIGDPNNLKFIGTHPMRVNEYPFALRGSYLFQCANSDDLEIYKLISADSLNPNLLKTTTLISKTKIYGLSGDMTVAFEQNYLFLGGNGNRIYIIDIADPAKPVIEGQMIVQHNNGFQKYGKYLFAFGNGNFDIIDISKPKYPKPIKRYDIVYNSKAFAIRKKYLYLGSSSLSVYDISDPYHVKLVKWIDTSPDELQQFYFLGNYIVAPSFAYTWATPYQNLVIFSGNIP